MARLSEWNACGQTTEAEAGMPGTTGSRPEQGCLRGGEGSRSGITAPMVAKPEDGWSLGVEATVLGVKGNPRRVPFFARRLPIS